MPSVSPLLLAIAGASLVSAHGYVTKITMGGQEYEGWNPGAKSPMNGICWRETATDNGFVMPSAFGTSDIACHRGGQAATRSAKVAAGSKINLVWNTWPESHKGPVMSYLAHCNGDCDNVQPGDLSFFKIAEAGYNGGRWATDDLIARDNSWDIIIPESLKAGQYVLRHEIMALHSASQEDGAQSYPQCFSLEVTGGGSELPAGTPATSLYKPDDAGIKINIYVGFSSYVIPGPRVAFGASPPETDAPAPTTSSAAPTTTSSFTTVTTPTTASTTTPAAAVTSPIGVVFPTGVPTDVEPTAVVSAVPEKPCKKRRHARQVKQL